jgi:hypothetical protein
MQRGKPEAAMLIVQDALKREPYSSARGNGPLNYLVEHVGDLTHRMAEKYATLPGSEMGIEYVEPKLRSAVRILSNRIDFQLLNEFPEMPELARYAQEHKKLPVYNEAQRLARDAAVAIGERNFGIARDNLQKLKDMVDNGEYAEEASKFTPDGEDYVYHVTRTEYVPKIKNKGLLPMQTSNWIQAGSKSRYGGGDVYVFSDKQDAQRWAAKMDWDLNNKMGSGKVSIVTVKRPKSVKFEIDKNDPFSQAGRKGQWLKTQERITPENIVSAESFDPNVIRQQSEKTEVKISKANEERVDNVIRQQIENAPRGFIPRFNPNAQKAATLAAIQYEIDGRETELPDFARKYMLSSIQEEEIPNSIINKETSRHGKIKAEPVTLTEKAINLLDSWKLGGFSEDFDNFSRVFRKAVVDRYNEFRRQETELIGSENEGLLMAETSASSALGMLDRARGIVAQMLNKGGIRWVTGDEMVTNDPTQFKGDNLAGYYEIDPNVPGLLDSLSKVMDGSVPKGLSVFKTYSTYKRIQGFRQRARDAAIRLANMDQASDPQTAAALKLIIEAEKKARLIDNPSDARISQFIAEVETDYPQVKEAYDNYQKWNTTLIDFGKSTGILTEELAQQWKDWGDYFPFYEEMEESIVGGMGYKKGSSLTRSDFFFKQLENRAKDLDQADPFEMITKNAYGILVSGLKNVAARRILRNSEAVGEARKVPDAKTARALRKRGSFTQSVLVDGLEQHYEIADPLLYESMMNYGESALGMITKIASAPAGLLREMVTREPGFILLNMLRDTVSTYVTSGVDYIPFIDSFKEFNSEEMQRLIDQGVVGGYDLSADPSDLKRYVADEYRKRGIDVKTHSQTSSNMARQLWDALGGYSQKSDAAVRTAVYKKVLAETGSEATARLAAIDVLNFSRRGANPLWRSITATIPFLNARIQGLDKIYTTLTGKYSPYDGLDPRVLTQKRALLRGGAIAAMTGIYFLLMSDNEEYKKARREVRDDNWIIPTGVEGVTLKLPIPFEIGAIFKTVPEIFLNFTFGDLDARGARDSIVRQINNSTNIDLLGFQAIKPLVDVMRNRDSFTGKEIVPYWVNKSTEVSQQYDDRTTEISKYIGNLFNISPMKLDYLIGGYGGSLGTSLLLTANAAWEQASGDKTAGTRADWTDINNIPVIRRFLMDTRLGGVGTRVQQDYYELRDEVRKAVATLNKFKEENDVDGYYAYQNSKLGLLNVRQEVLAIDKYLKRYRDTRDALRKSDLPPDTIRKLLREIEDEKNLRLTVVPTLRERADIPANIGSAIFDAFIG